MQLDLEGRVALVTGVSRGIGAAVASSLLAEGVRVVGVSRTAPDDLDPRVTHHQADLTTPEAPERVVAETLAEHRRLDVLVNNIGGGQLTPGFTDLDDEAWNRMLDLNLMAEHTETTRVCQEADGSLSLPSQTKTEQVPGFGVRVRNSCDPALILSPASAEVPMACVETFDVSGLVLTLDLRGAATAEPGGAVTVEGTTVDTTHVRIDLTATGDLNGHAIEDWWVTTEGLPVKMVRDIDLGGPGHFVECSTLILRSLEPRT